MSRASTIARLAKRTLFSLAFAAVTTSAVHAQQPVHIGSILSVTGPAAFLGEDMKLGMEMAIEDINKGGGVLGKPVKWTFYDAESQTAKAINATRRLISQDKVDVIVGGGNMSGIALAMAPMTERAATPFISTEGSAAIVNPVKDRPNTFKTTADDSQMIDRLFDYFEKKGIKKVALLADSSGFGQSAVEQMKLIAPKRGAEVIYESFNPSDTDLTPQLTKIKNANVDAIVCWTVTPAGVIFIKQADQLGLSDKTLVHSYGFVSQRYMELAGDSVKNLLLLSVKFPVAADLPDSDPLKKRILAMTERFKQRFNRAPNQYVAQTYDGIMLAAKSLEAGKGDKTKVAAELEKTKNFPGMGGMLSFSPEQHSGLSKSDIVLLGFKNGNFYLADYK